MGLDYFKLKEVELHVCDSGYGRYYTQNIQATSFSYSILKRESKKSNIFHELHEKATCREYLGEFVKGSHFNEDVSIYGLTLDPGERWSTEETLLSVDMSNIELKMFLANISILFRLEIKLGLSKTKVYRTSSSSLVLVGSSFWVKSPLTISIYSMILRGLVYEIPKEIKTIMPMIKYLSSLYNTDDSNVNDVYQATKIDKSGINLEVILINIDKILGSSPITGANDSYYRESKLCRDSRGNRISINHNFHGGHGIVSFVKLYSDTYFWEWVNNYQSLSSEERCPINT